MANIGFIGILMKARGYTAGPFERRFDMVLPGNPAGGMLVGSAG
jgi:hypothetical protein